MDFFESVEQEGGFYNKNLTAIFTYPLNFNRILCSLHQGITIIIIVNFFFDPNVSNE